MNECKFIRTCETKAKQNKATQEKGEVIIIKLQLNTLI